MDKRIVLVLLAGVMLALAPVACSWAQAGSDAARLDTLQRRIDAEAAGTATSSKVQALATQFQVSPGVVEGLRASKQGWGEIAIGLAMAQRLSQTDPENYPTLTDGLQRIETLRGEKMGWGEIAKTLGFKLGPVVSAAARARQDLVRASRPARPQRPAKVERGARPERPAHPSPPARPDRPGWNR